MHAVAWSRRRPRPRPGPDSERRSALQSVPSQPLSIDVWRPLLVPLIYAPSSSKNHSQTSIVSFSGRNYPFIQHVRGSFDRCALRASALITITRISRNPEANDVDREEPRGASTYNRRDGVEGCGAADGSQGYKGCRSRSTSRFRLRSQAWVVRVYTSRGVPRLYTCQRTAQMLTSGPRPTYSPLDPSTVPWLSCLKA